MERRRPIDPSPTIEQAANGGFTLRQWSVVGLRYFDRLEFVCVKPRQRSEVRRAMLAAEDEAA
jgi:hypothetical protein